MKLSHLWLCTLNSNDLDQEIHSYIKSLLTRSTLVDSMKIILIGNGAREHIIAEKLAEDSDVYAIMSKKNPAIAKLCKGYWIADITNPNAISEILGNIKKEKIQLAFSSPDATLAAGISDVLEEHGLFVASPSKKGSRIEWDKQFMRELMEKHQINGRVMNKVVTTKSDAEQTIREYVNVAVKPIGLTCGKGVKVSKDHFPKIEDAIDYANEWIEKDGKVLIEEELRGEEFTFQAFSDGQTITTMPPVQDHKRAFVGDTGPNTGGMGSYSTGKLLPFLSQKDLDNAREIMQKVITALNTEGHKFVGVLYGQFMLTKDGPKVIEFNARFGDPEAINVLALLKTSLYKVFLSMAKGKLCEVKFDKKCTVVKYLVPEGYPDNPKKDQEVSIEGAVENGRAKVYYASVYEKDGKIYTTSSRAFAILGVADTLEDAEKIAEEGCKNVKGPVWHREDIGTKDLVQKRVEHMEKIRGLNS